MHPAFVSRGGATSVPVWFVTTDTYAQVREQLGAAARRFAETAKFEPKAGQSLLLPGDGRRAVAACCSASKPPDRPEKDRFLPGRLPGLLPAGTYRFANAPHDPRLAALAFALGTYQFTRYRKAEANGAQLELPDGVDGAELSRIAEGVTLARDLINTPANDIGPAELEEAARALAERHGASVSSDRRRRPAEAELSADPRRRPRRAARAAADRPHLGRSGSIRRSRWSARACASTPAGSTSSPQPAC